MNHDRTNDANDSSAGSMTGNMAGSMTGSMAGIPAAFEDLYCAAKGVLNPRRLSKHAEVGGVGAALLTAAGNIYTGVCIDTACSMGFCAEHAAAAAMITAGENKVVKMVAVDWDGTILPPCGRCREFISQLDDANVEAAVLVAPQTVLTLRELMPYDWRKRGTPG